MSKGLKYAIILSVFAGAIFGAVQFFSPKEEVQTSVKAKKTTNISNLNRFFTINKKLHEYAEQDLVSKILEYKLNNGLVGKQRQYSDFFNKKWMRSLLVYMYDDLKIDIQQVTSYFELSLEYHEKRDSYRETSYKRHGEGEKFNKEFQLQHQELKSEYLSTCEELLGEKDYGSISAYRDAFNKIISNELNKNYIDFKIIVEI